MSFFIFQKNMDNLPGSIYKIAETEDYLNNMLFNKLHYKIIQVSQQNFDSVKLSLKTIENYNGNDVIYSDVGENFYSEQELKNYIDNFKSVINTYSINNKNHSLFTLWNNYYNQLNNLELNFLTLKIQDSSLKPGYGIYKSLEKHFHDLGQPSLHPLQLP